MATYNFSPVPAWGQAGSFARIGAKKSTTFPCTLPGGGSATVVQGGATKVGYVESDANGLIPAFTTTDIPSVDINFGVAVLRVNSAEAITSGASSAAAAASSATDAANSASAAASSASSAAATVAGKVSKDTQTLFLPDHGVVGDGTTDDAAAFQSALNTAATFGLRVQFAPKSVVKCATAITPPSGSRIDLNGATIKNAINDNSGRVLLLDAVTDIVIEGGTIDGDKANYAPATEQRHNIHIIGCTRVTLRDVRSVNAKGDGIYIGDDTAGCADVVLDRVTCDANYRNGMSIIAVDGLKAFACRFTNTSGTAPEFGVDVEPNQDATLVRGIKMVACHFSGNAAIGLGVTLRATPTVEQSVGEYVACTIEGNGTVGRSWLGGVYLNNGRNAKFVGGSISRNTGRGVYTPSTGTVSDCKFTEVDINGNTSAGVAIFAPYTRLAFVGCTILDNTGIGMDVSPSAASVGFRWIGNTSGNSVTSGGTQTFGISTHSSSSSVVLIGNTYPNNTSGAAALGDNVATRTMIDASSVPTITGAKGGNTALAGLLTALANRGFIVDSTTA